MNTPCSTRSAANIGRLGMVASSAVGIASSNRAVATPRRRSTRWLKSATARPANAMPNVVAFTATAIVAGDTA